MDGRVTPVYRVYLASDDEVVFPRVCTAPLECLYFIEVLRELLPGYQFAWKEISSYVPVYPRRPGN